MYTFHTCGAERKIQFAHACVLEPTNVPIKDAVRKRGCGWLNVYTVNNCGARWQNQWGKVYTFQACNAETETGAGPGPGLWTGTLVERWRLKENILPTFQIRGLCPGEKLALG